MNKVINDADKLPSGVCAFDCGRECIALIQKRCYNCKFRKTAAQITQSRNDCIARLRSIGADDLIEKYWKKK